MEEKKQKNTSIGWALLFLLIGAGIAAALFFFLGGRSGSEVLAMFQAPTETPTVMPTVKATVAPTDSDELDPESAKEIAYSLIENLALDPETGYPEDSSLRKYYKNRNIDIEIIGRNLLFAPTTYLNYEDYYSLSWDLILTGSWISQDKNWNLNKILVAFHGPKNISINYSVTGSDVISGIANSTIAIDDVLSFEYDCGGDLCCEDYMNNVPESERRCNNNQAQAPMEGVGPYVAQNCVLWSDVTLDDVGKEMCVYGVVKKTRIENDILYMTFGDNARDFYFLDYGGYWGETPENNCALSEGKIKQLGNAPVMVVDGKLFHCE